MEKDSVNENKIKSEVEEMEVQGLINDENNYDDINQYSCKKYILANILDQLLVVAASTVLVLLSDVVLRLFGYMFIKGTGAIFIAGGIIYFILNCIYGPIMKKTKAKNTIAKKILNIN